jgi:hypothetical protein
VSVGFRLFRITDTGEQLVGSLTPLEYSEDTCRDFNLLLGHPILAWRRAANAGARTMLARDCYHRSARAPPPTDTRFTIIAVQRHCWPARRLFSARASRAVRRRVLEPALDVIAGPSPPATVLRLLDLAQQRQFASLLRDTAVPASDRGLGR